MTATLRAALAVDLPEDDCLLIERLEPRVELLRDHSLNRPARWDADWEGDPTFARTPEQEAAFTALLDGADALFGIPDVQPARLAAVVRANPSLRWVHATAAGGGAQVRAAGLTSAELERVAFTTSAGVHGSTLAEFALFGILAGAKDLRRLEDDQAARHWPAERWAMRHLDEMTVLIVGLGGIGAATAARFKACGSTVWGTSRSGRPVEHVDRVVPLDELAAAAAQVDAIVVTLPGTAATEKLIGAELLAGVRPGTLLANVGRGTVIDEDALLRALDDGRIGFAALDVFATEPLPQQSPLWGHPRVLASPHTAALSRQEGRRIARLFARNATALLDGAPMANVVDTVEFY
ncbi:D-2-hydroxyacid dehydrogenase [Tsukamurella paurometabola]|uniref:D-2-hydroxyacid dehydrogenase n=1 Tax=Tsukamurella paurometabola TaxID=2061 RepID=A0A3P8MB65_TSUPA|nr:D-2-hydroxyacid dehydrogenase [Tsukamurella paurometabola]MBS4103996.1 D-2-hydroxyacid dehydrogenase [Tsukamurella paurometabola]UEA84977.1 D-2-hydroxyacid dehydrogenase [Tsukamurella paurometabola]VDR37576.1 Glyoxylate/hydroxypyruvate reductase A [Tsukamurella paurometabola]